METCIKSNEVRHPQGSHRMPVSQLGSPVNLFRGRFPFVNHLDSLVQHGNINACRKKSRVVFGNHVLFSQGLAQIFNRFHRLIGSEIAADDFHQCHDLGRIEKMHSNESFRPFGGCRQFGNRKGRSIRCQDGLIRHYTIQS